MRATVSKLRLAVSASAFTLAATAFPATANAATCNWLTAAGNWVTSGNWSCGVQPGSADDAVITNAGAVVTLSGTNTGVGTINLGSGNALTITGGSTLFINNNALANNGIVTVSNNSDFRSGSGIVTVGGTGTILLDSSVANARLFGGGWIFGSGQTVRGTGELGINQGIFSNAGLMSADVNGGTLSIDATGGNGGTGAGNGFGTNANAGFYNTGTLQATGGGILAFQSGLYENGAGGLIRANTGSSVNLNNDARIVGGTLTTIGTGVINTTGGNEYLQNVTLSSGSKLTVAAGNSLWLNNSFVNNGVVTIDNGSDLRNEVGTLTITGTGQIVFGGTGANRIFGNNIVFGSNQNVTGAGQIGINQTTITNNAVFAVNSGGTLSIDATGGNGGTGAGNGVGTGANSGLFNTGTIVATGGSTISFESGLYENSGAGIIRANAGSVIGLNNDARILGGTLASVGTGAINTTGGNEYLTNVTLASGSNLNVAATNSLFLNTLFTNNGTLTVNNGSDLRSETANLTINGTGTIVLGSNGANRIYGGNITFGAGQTVQGTGQLGINQTIFTINNVFSANAGTVLSIDATGGNGGTGAGNGVGTNANSGMLNNSIIQATGGSSLNFESGLYENSASGVIQALTGSFVNLNNDARILNGTLTTAGTGVINATGGNEYLTNVTLSAGSRLNVAATNSLFLNTGFVNNGIVTIDNGSDLRNEGGTLTITGNGQIVLGGNGTNRLWGGNVVFGSNQNVTGTGQLGINQTTITNNATFSVNTGGTLSIDATGGNGGTGAGNGVGTAANSSLLNNGTIESTGGSTVAFESGLYENSGAGVVRAGTGSFVNLNNDARILNGTLASIGTGAINATGGNEYLTNVTLATGSNLNVAATNSLFLNTLFTNNGTVTVNNGSDLRSETAALAINGTGTIVLGAGGLNRLWGGMITIGSGQTISGQGQFGINQTNIVNNGTISAITGNLSIDVSGGSGSPGGFVNNGLAQATGGGTLSFESGSYANGTTGAGGRLFAGAGSLVVFNNDATFANLVGGGVLDGGQLYAQNGTINLRSLAANTLGTIGTTGGAATAVTLEGASSVIEVTPWSGGAPVTIDQTLSGTANSGSFGLKNRNFAVVANSGVFGNAGLTSLNNSAFTATSFVNSGQLVSDGLSAMLAPITNSGLVRVASGTLTTQAITGPAGTITTNAGATLQLGGASTAGTLNNNGTLALGANNIIVSSDYTNANFGAGNAFNGHANVTGSGLIFASSATMDLSGPALSGGTLNVGNVRTGGSSATTLTITNNGTATTLRGAVQNGSAPSVALSAPDFVLTPGGGSATVTISYTGLTAGSLAGQSLNVVNNFDNVANATIGLAGNIYQVAQAGTQPSSLVLGARRVGDAAGSATITIANTAPITPGFNEALRANASANNSFLLNGAGTASVNNLAAGSSAPLTLTRGTGTAGAFTGTVSIANTSLAVAGSGLADLALAGQTIAVTNNVYAAAVANLTGTTVNFGTVRRGATSPTGSVGVTNGATGALTDSLVTTVGATPAGVTAGAAPGPLAAGQSGNVAFSLSTAAAGVVSGATQLAFKSSNSEMADLNLASQTVNFAGTVTDLSVASIFKNAGAGTFSGGGTSYTYDLGTLAANSGSFATDFGVANLVSLSSFSEMLGGNFVQSAGTGYVFSGNSFSGVQGGSSNLGNLLTFDTTGLSAGTYGKTFTFNGFSAYPGLNNQNLAPITVTITAQVTGGTGNPNPGAVPEPATWAMMIIGFGMIGGSMRTTRRRRADVAA